MYPRCLSIRDVGAIRRADRVDPLALVAHIARAAVIDHADVPIRRSRAAPLGQIAQIAQIDAAAGAEEWTGGQAVRGTAAAHPTAAASKAAIARRAAPHVVRRERMPRLSHCAASIRPMSRPMAWAKGAS
jgi:hypothetical protein